MSTMSNGQGSQSHEDFYSPEQSPSKSLQHDLVGSARQPSYSPLFFSQDHTPPYPSPVNADRQYAVIIPAVERPWEYAIYEDNTSNRVLKVVRAHGSKYLVRFQDDHELIVSISLWSNKKKATKLTYTGSR